MLNRKTSRGCFVAMAASITIASWAPVHAQVQDMLPSKEAVSARIDPSQFSPYVGRVFPTQVYWGDTHTHTMVSVDAGTMTRLTQEDAFRFARGEEVTALFAGPGLADAFRAFLAEDVEWLFMS